VRRLALLCLPCVAWLASACLGFSGASEETPGAVTPRAHANGPIWFLGGQRPGSAFGQPSGAYRVGLAGGRIVKLPIGTPLYSVTGLAASPDGEWLAMSNGGGEFPPRNIYVMRSDGTEVRQITSGNFYEVSPEWSPDSDEILFSSTRCCATSSFSGNYALYTIRPDGSGLHRVMEDDANELSPAWSPAGDRIAYVRTPVDWGRSQIWVVNTDGTNSLSLTQDARYYADVAWSPDGRWLATISHLTDDRDWQVRVMRADGSAVRTLVTCTSPCRRGGSSLTWSPDGAQIAFTIYTKADTDTPPRLALADVAKASFTLADTHGVGACCLSWIGAD
jgi:Tol biopolymer transport system component